MSREAGWILLYDNMYVFEAYVLEDQNTRQPFPPSSILASGYCYGSWASFSIVGVSQWHLLALFQLFLACSLETIIHDGKITREVSITCHSKWGDAKGVGLDLVARKQTGKLMSTWWSSPLEIYGWRVIALSCSGMSLLYQEYGLTGSVLDEIRLLKYTANIVSTCQHGEKRLDAGLCVNLRTDSCPNESFGGMLFGWE